VSGAIAPAEVLREGDSVRPSRNQEASGGRCLDKLRLAADTSSREQRVLLAGGRRRKCCLQHPLSGAFTFTHVDLVDTTHRLV
jgi:hypothetical protein